MTKIEVEDLVFGRVEPEFSPKRDAGYQTIVWSQGISSTTIREVEALMRCFMPESDDDRRIQFAKLSNSQWLVSKSIRPAPDREVFDKNERRTFLGHGYIVSTETMERIHWNPFAILDSATFISSADELRQRIAESRGGDGPPRTVIEVVGKGSLTESVDDVEAKALGDLTRKAKKLARRNESIQLHGSRSNVERALRIAFHFGDRRDRPDCTFDSAVDGCSVPAGRYFLVGVVRSDRRPGFTPIAATNVPKGSSDAPSEEEDGAVRSIYRNWWQQAYVEMGHLEVVEAAARIRPLVEALEGFPVDLSGFRYDEVSKQSYDILRRSAEDEILMRIKAHVAKTSRILAGFIAPWISRSVTSKKAIVLALSPELPSQELAKLLTRMLDSGTLPRFIPRRIVESLISGHLPPEAEVTRLLLAETSIASEAEAPLALPLLSTAPVVPAEAIETVVERPTTNDEEPRSRARRLPTEAAPSDFPGARASSESSSPEPAPRSGFERFDPEIHDEGRKSAIAEPRPDAETAPASSPRSSMSPTEMSSAPTIRRSDAPTIEPRSNEESANEPIPIDGPSTHPPSEPTAGTPPPRFDSKRGRSIGREIAGTPIMPEPKKKPGFLQMLKLPFGSKKDAIPCPYCLRVSAVKESEDKCRHCGEPFPQLYRRHYAESPPIFVPLVGDTNVGKTVFLFAMTHRFVNMPKTFWPKYSWAPDSPATLRFVQRVVRDLAVGELPDATVVKREKLESNEIYAITLRGIERWGGRMLVLRDYSGELFKEFELPAETIPFLLTARVSFFMFDILELMRRPDLRMDLLLNAYIQMLLRAKKDIARERKKIVVILAQADRLGNLPTEIHEYLAGDPLLSQSTNYMTDREMRRYAEKMAAMSSHLEDWLLNQKSLGGQVSNFLETAARESIEVKFSMISSLGARAEGRKMTEPLNPMRVLDPFFWAMELDRGLGEFESGQHP